MSAIVCKRHVGIGIEKIEFHIHLFLLFPGGKIRINFQYFAISTLQIYKKAISLSPDKYGI